VTPSTCKIDSRFLASELIESLPQAGFAVAPLDRFDAAIFRIRRA
jgi:hypothetical protein